MTTPPDGILEKEAPANPAEQVVLVRKKLGLSQEAFARLLNTPVGTIRGWEQNRREPPPCALVLMQIAVDHPHVMPTAKDDTVKEQPEKRKPQTQREVAANFHKPGQDSDFWML